MSLAALLDSKTHGATPICVVAMEILV